MSRFFVEESKGKAYLYLKRQVYGRKRLPLKGFSFEALWDIKHAIDSGHVLREIPEYGGWELNVWMCSTLRIGDKILMTVYSQEEREKKLIPLMNKLSSYGIPKE